MVNRIHMLKAVSAVSLALFTNLASAHVGYGTALYDQATNAYAGAGSGGLNPTASSNAGWISGLSDNGVNRTAALDTFGDTHNNRFRFFTLTQQSQVSLTVSGAVNSNGASILNPGMSIFSGMVPASSHDGVGDTNGLSPAAITSLQTPAINAYLASHPGYASWSSFYDANDEIIANGGGTTFDKWGVFKSDGNFEMGNNKGLVSGVTFIDAVADMANGSYADGNVDNSVSWNGILGPGTYTLTIGGASLNDLNSLFTAVQLGVPGPSSTSCAFNGDPGCNGTAWPGDATIEGAYANLRLARNINIAMDVQPVPVPGAVWLLGSAMVGLIGLGRKKAIAA